MAQVQNCSFEVSKSEQQSCYYVHFRVSALGKDLKPLILPAMGLMVSLLSFYKDGFRIE